MTGPGCPGEIVPLIDSDPARLVAAVLRVRAAGGIPLVGDDRWTPQHWAGIRRSVAHAPRRPELAWAALTSGSTGTPRIVVRTAESWSASFAAIDALLELRPDDVIYLPAPPASSLSLFSIAHAHTHAQAHAHAAGVTLALPSAHTVVARDFAGATVFHGTPRALQSVVEAIDGDAPHRLRVALVGGSDLDPALRERAAGHGIRVVGYYGAAELSFVAVDEGDGLRPFPGVDVESRESVLWVRSPFVSSGYLGDGGPFRRDGEGWSTVGDLADVADGQIQLRGRADGAILTAAATVIPSEVEAVLRGIDGVGDAVVFGLPNAGVGALVSAVIEPEPSRTMPAITSLRAQAAAGLTLTHLPRRWFGMGELPRTVTGKPARAEIVRRVLSGEVASLDDSVR
ncbi:class I adenylate-forming enzyme family protein [Leifsonia sp. NPDC058248]|uniref:class I adenylate-forming enzyme family protein n=1 Tax=Leifsonia sp. NPDC058248 TaxID=3346402 RepID=UPI0036DA56C2